jgi:hypothetical protein
MTTPTFAFYNDATLATLLTTLALERPQSAPVTRQIWLASRETGRRLVPTAGEDGIRLIIAGALAYHVALAATLAGLETATPGDPLDLGAMVLLPTPIYLRVLPGLPEGAANIPLTLAAREEIRTH